MSLKPHQRSLLIAGLVLVVLWAVPVASWVALPLQYLYTHLHELGHGLSAVLTGGEVEYIKVFADGSGVTYSGGGIGLFVAAGGYVGATVMGALLLGAAHTPKAARTALMVLGAILGIATLAWIRGDWVGVVSAAVFTLVLIGSASVLKDQQVVFLAQFFGLYLCLASLQSVLALFGMAAYPIDNDAKILERHTGIPAFLSAFVWSAVSVGLVFATVRRSWNPRLDSPATR